MRDHEYNYVSFYKSWSAWTILFNQSEVIFKLCVL